MNNLDIFINFYIELSAIRSLLCYFNVLRVICMPCYLTAATYVDSLLLSYWYVLVNLCASKYVIFKYQQYAHLANHNINTDILMNARLNSQ